MASMQIEQPAASAKEDPDMNMFLSSDAGMSWMANQLAHWDASAKRSLASFGDGLRDKFEKEVKPRLPPLPPPPQLPTMPWDEAARASSAQSGAAGISAPAGAFPPLQWQMPSLPSFHLPPNLLNKYFNARVKVVIDENVAKILKAASAFVPACCVAFEGAKQAAMYGIRHATGPLGPITKWVFNAALPTGFFGPAVGCFLTVKYLLRKHEQEQAKRQAEELARKGALTAAPQLPAAGGNFEDFLKTIMPQPQPQPQPPKPAK